MSRLLTVVVFCFATLHPAIPAALGQTVPTSDPQALAFAAKSITAMTGGNSISDVTLTGTVTWNAASDTGTANLRALGTGESRMDLALSAGTRTEMRDAQTGVALGQWTNPNSSTGMSAYQNCQTDAVWFFPALGSLAAGSNVVLSYIGQQTWNGTTVQHIQSYIYQSSPPPIPGTTAQQLSTMDFYLDATTLLPVSVTFNAYPDNSTASPLLIEVDFSNYQSIGGVLVPMSIQRSSQGNVEVSVSVTNAALNTGLSLSLFSIN